MACSWIKIAALGMLAGLAGCASQPGAQGPYDDVDEAKVQSVERAASHMGVKVYWINMPRKSR